MKRLILILMTCSLLFTSLYFLLATSAGSSFLVSNIIRISNGHLKVEKIQGNLVDGLALENIAYSSSSHSITIKKLDTNLSWLALFGGYLQINKLDINTIKIIIKKNNSSQPTSLGWLKYLSIVDLCINGADISLPKQAPSYPQQVQFSLNYRRGEIKITRLKLKTKEVIIDLNTLGNNQLSGRIFLPSLNLSFTDMTIQTLNYANGLIHFNLAFKSGKSLARSLGSINLSDPSFASNIQIQGDHLLLVNLHEYKITASPQIKIDYNTDHTNVTGKLVLNSARITPDDFSMLTTLPNEVIIKGETKKMTNPMPELSAQIELVLDRDIYISYHNLTTFLKGRLWISKEANQFAYAAGELSTRKGFYQAYGQSLKIRRGRLIYAHNVLTTPGIDIKTIKRVNTASFAEDRSGEHHSQAIYQGLRKLSVGVWIKGTFEDPLVSLFSLPSGLPQNDILSYLLFGYPQSQIKNLSSLSLLTSLSSNLTSPSTQVTQITNKIKNTLGIKTIGLSDIQTFNSESNRLQTNTALNIEKKLGRKILIQYRVGVFRPLSVLNIKYRINKLLSIQSETSSFDHGADLLFEYEHD